MKIGRYGKIIVVVAFAGSFGSSPFLSSILLYLSLNFLLGQVVGQEWIILAVLGIILLFGAKKVPEIARSLGRAKGEFERGKMELEKELRAIERSSILNSVTSKSKMVRAAKELGIDTEGKSGKELKEQIGKKMHE